MKTKPNPKAIGIFVIASITLLFVFILYFGGTTYSKSSKRYILFFDQSVNGLTVGSAVKFRGVPVGSVEKILLRTIGQSPDSDSIPVIIKIDHARLARELYNEVPMPRTTDDLLARGMVGKLGLESIITGLLFVEFSIESEGGYESEEEIRVVGGLTEIPTLGTSLDEITSDMAGIIGQLATVDLVQLVHDIDTLFVSTTKLVEGIDAYAITDSFVDAARSVEELAGSDEIPETLVAIKEALGVFEETTASFNLNSGPVADVVEGLQKDLSKTLNGVDELVANTNSIIAPDAGARYELEQSLRDLSQAAQSIKRLTDYLEANPNALITGRPE